MHHSPIEAADPHARAAHVLGLLRGVPDDLFRPVVIVARHLLETPIAAINFLEGDLLWNKVASGARIDPLPRTATLCDWTVRTEAPLVVPDLALDPRFAGLGAVVDMGLRFYAGVPLTVADRETGAATAIGALCIADMVPRAVTPATMESLRALGDIAQSVIASHVAAERAIDMANLANTQADALRRQERVFEQAERMARIGSWRLTLEGNALHWSAGVRRIHELPPGAVVPVEDALSFYPPHAQQRVSDVLANSIASGEPFDFETDFTTATGRARRVRSIGEMETAEGRPIALTGVFQDVTDRWALEQQLRHSAAHDPLTGLANRTAFDAALGDALDAARAGDAPCALALIDLDHFKTVNDTHGHNAGDDVLRAVAERLRDAPFPVRLAARLGGDEFALIVTDPDACRDLEAGVQAVAAAIRRPVPSGDAMLPASATIGYASAEGGMAARELVHRADLALYRAKRAGRGGVAGYQAWTGEERRAPR